MIQKVKKIPEKGVAVGRRMNELQEFIESKNKLGVYKLKAGEVVENVYHSFKNAIYRMRLADHVDITIRRGEIYFIRRDS